jgi:hypothetical protein
VGADEVVERRGEVLLAEVTPGISDARNTTRVGLLEPILRQQDPRYQCIPHRSVDYGTQDRRRGLYTFFR